MAEIRKEMEKKPTIPAKRPAVTLSMADSSSKRDTPLLWV
jgi:hypothetical protein